MTKGQRDGGTVSHTLTGHTTMADLIEEWPAARKVLARRGMACLGCAMAAFETISDAAEAYGFDAGDLIREVAAQTRPRDNKAMSH